PSFFSPIVWSAAYTRPARCAPRTFVQAGRRPKASLTHVALNRIAATLKTASVSWDTAPAMKASSPDVKSPATVAADVEIHAEKPEGSAHFRSARRTRSIAPIRSASKRPANGARKRVVTPAPSRSKKGAAVQHVAKKARARRTKGGAMNNGLSQA